MGKKESNSVKHVMGPTKTIKFPPTGRKIDREGGFNFFFQSCPCATTTACAATTAYATFLPPHAAAPSTREIFILATNRE